MQQHWFVQTLSPVAFEIFGLPIRWYGLSYIAGFLVGQQILAIRSRADARYPKTFDPGDFLLYAAIGAVVGGRLGEVLFYNPEHYLRHPIQIFFLWSGGMSSHGGMIGVFLATILYSRRHGINKFVLIDDVVVAALPGLFFGRLANFINSEMVGKITDVRWAVIFPSIDQFPRHPVQIYQALAEGPILALLLLAASRTFALLPGQLASVFLISYGLLRFVTERFRELNPDYLGYWHELTQGQLLSIGMILIGLICFAIFGSSKKADGSAL
jgi:phosphatidylglycerol:prolipoprotein diacylglycerol transferase